VSGVEAITTRRSAAGRYLAVSVLALAAHQVVLAVANSGWGWSGGVANTFAALVVAVPGYVASRHWIWESPRGRHSLRGEILPFGVVAVVGLVVTTLLAEAADRAFGSGLPVLAGSIVGSGLVWLAKFLVLEKLFLS
jgi:putative flippase GtrA